MFSIFGDRNVCAIIWIDISMHENTILTAFWYFDVLIRGVAVGQPALL